MKIFVTGASGFLGNHLINHLKAAGHEVTGVGSKQCDLTQASSLDRYNTERWDQIYHLAAWTQAGDFCLKHPGEQWIMNQQINTNVLSWWSGKQPQAKMIAIGTSCCYEPGKPHREENFLIGEPIESLYTYAMTKRMLLIGLQSLAKQFNLKYLYVIPSTLYGSGYHLDGRQMHFIFDLLRKIVDYKRKGTPVVLWGDGHQKRELIDVECFIRTMHELSLKIENDLFNIGGGSEYSIRHFAESLAKIVGVDPAAISYDTSKYVGATSKFLDVEKVKKTLPHFKPLDLETGLRQIADWYLKNAD